MLSENALKMLKEKNYFKDNETKWEDICERVSNAIASAENNDDMFLRVKDQIYKAMCDLEFIFSTPCLINADIGNKGQLSSCFIVSMKDNIESINQCDAEYSKIFQKNGGAGASLSTLRPARSVVETSNGYAFGVIGAMQKFDYTADLMTKFNLSRKGAIKKDINDWHPDIYDFIHSKDDTSKLQKMNISVVLSDKFLSAVENNEDWDLKFPDYSFNKEIYDNEWDGDIGKWESNGYPIKVYKTVKAKELFEEICDCAWRTGEPGFNYLSSMMECNKNTHITTIVGSNPCFTGDMKLLTTEGYKLFKELENTKFKCVSNDGTVSDGKVWSNGIKKIIELKLSNKEIIKCTPNHIFMISNGSDCKASKTKGKRLAPNFNYFKTFENEYIKLGFIQGDGVISRIHSDKHSGIEVCIGKNDEDIFKLFKDEDYKRNAKNAKRAIYIKNIKEKLIDLGFDGSILTKRIFPTSYTDWTFCQKSSFLQGCYSANGSIIKKTRISYKATCKEFILQLAETLKKDFGITAYVTTNKPHIVKFNNGDYECKESYDLNIHKYESIVKFHDEIGFYHDYKKEQLNELIAYRCPMVTKISELKEEEVFDFSEPNNHWGFVNGFAAHNCGEFLNIPYSSCNLGSINLVKCVKKDKSFDYKKFKNLVNMAIRWLDNMITINKLPLKKIDEITKNIRAVGLGVMGFADSLFMMGIKYNSTESYEFSNNLFKTMYDTALETSQQLAKERGVYPAWEGSEWQKIGIEVRNSNFLSIAPTGSISFIANVSGGIEPGFGLVYSRRTYDGTMYYVVNEIFKKALEDRNMYSDTLMEKIEKNHGSCKGIKEIPKDLQEIFVTAHDIPPKEHVKMLSVIQKHIDLSISKTINFDNTAKIEDIKEIVLYGWKSGCRGLTVYRDGSRENQTLSTSSSVKKEKNEVKLDNIEPINRKTFGKVTGTTEYKNVACGKMYITVNKDKDNNIMEIIIAAGKHGICSANAETISRLVSGWLRAGISVKSLIKLLKGIKCPACLTAKGKGKNLDGISCSDTLGRCIEEAYNENCELKITTSKPKINKDKKINNRCPDCGQELISDGNCKSCSNCGFSKCG